MAAPDISKHRLFSQAHDFFDITPDDANPLPNITMGIYIGGDGDLAVLSQTGVTAIYVGVVAGTLLPIPVVQVFVTGTTATNLVGVI